MEFSQPCCKRDEDFFCACLATGYVPAIWHQDKVVFIPKHGRSSYTGPRDFRPINLTSLLLKTRERLVDRYFKGQGSGSYATASQPACLPCWEIYGYSSSSVPSSG